ncbi:MAG: RimK family alpha-L-glutamate ligase [Gemmatimonadales bacterium]
MTLILLATGADMPELCSDDQLLLRALREHGIAARAVVWSDPAVSWGDASLVVIRSTWDYVERVEDFLQWVRRVDAVAPLLNSRALVERNWHKSYLRELVARGVAVVPARWYSAGQPVQVDEALAVWGTVAIKPAVGANGLDLLVGDDTLRDELQSHAERLISRHDLIVQKFLSSVAVEGELSLVYVDGMYAHTIRKFAGDGDYRVQEEHGGHAELATPPEPERSIADSLVESVGGSLYARVDFLYDDGRPVVGEFELIEPELYFRYHPPTIDRMVAAITNRLGL